MYEEKTGMKTAKICAYFMDVIIFGEKKMDGYG